MLSGAVYSIERLLVEKALKAMVVCYPLQGLHDQLVMVDFDIYLFVDWCQFMLCRCDFIMLGLCRDSELPELDIHIVHESADPLTDGSEVMVVHLLPLRRHSPDKSTSGIYQVFSGKEIFPVDDKILLLCAD